MRLTNLEDFGRAIDAVMDNGVALVEEAELLLSNGRTPRAYALAHLACEEFTKVPSLLVAAHKLFSGEAVDWREFAKSYRSHQAKIWRHVLLVTFTKPIPRTHNRMDHPAVLKSMLAQVRSLTPSKNAAIYVDVGENVIQTPQDAITKEMAAEAIKTARTVSGHHAAMNLDLLNKITTDSVADREKLDRVRDRLREILLASGLIDGGAA